MWKLDNSREGGVLTFRPLLLSELVYTTRSQATERSKGDETVPQRKTFNEKKVFSLSDVGKRKKVAFVETKDLGKEWRKDSHFWSDLRPLVSMTEVA